MGDETNNLPVASAVRRDWWTIAGFVIVGVAAVIASFSAQAGLAVLAGWSRPAALLLPVTIDVYGLTAVRLRSWVTSPHARKAADVNAAVAIVVSVAGNVVFHAVQAHALDLGGRRWLLVVAVGMVPPLALGALAHLAALASREQVVRPGPATVHDAVPAVAQARVREVGTGEAEPVDADCVSGEVRRGSEPVPVSGPGDPLLATATEVFAEELAAGKVPSLRRIKESLKVGQPRAVRIRAALAGT
jgi:hypothetical protein